MRRLLRGAGWLVRLEAQMYVGVARLLARRADVPDDAAAHPYVGAVAVLLWAFTAVSAVELVVLHLVIPWESVRLVADVVGIWGVVWILGLTGCHYVYPHLVDADHLQVRAARRRATARIPLGDVEAVVVRERTHEHSSGARLVPDVDRPEVAVTVGSRTNLEVRLRVPVEVDLGRGRRATVDRVHLFADRPALLRGALLAPT